MIDGSPHVEIRRCLEEFVTLNLFWSHEFHSSSHQNVPNTRRSHHQSSLDTSLKPRLLVWWSEDWSSQMLSASTTASKSHDGQIELAWLNKLTHAAQCFLYPTCFFSWSWQWSSQRAWERPRAWLYPTMLKSHVSLQRWHLVVMLGIAARPIEFHSAQ